MGFFALSSKPVVFTKVCSGCGKENARSGRIWCFECDIAYRIKKNRSELWRELFLAFVAAGHNSALCREYADDAFEHWRHDF